jgi:Basic region leucine zipper
MYACDVYAHCRGSMRYACLPKGCVIKLILMLQDLEVCPEVCVRVRRTTMSDRSESRACAAHTAHEADSAAGEARGQTAAALQRSVVHLSATLSAEPGMKQEQSATPLKGHGESKEDRRERNRLNAQHLRLRKKERIQQLQEELATCKEQVAAYKEREATAQHGAQNRQPVPAPDAMLNQDANTQQIQTQPALHVGCQQAEHNLDMQRAMLDCFFQWLCSSASCTEQQWATFAAQNCTLWLPIGSVQNTAATREAAQRRRTLVRFTGAANILSYGRQHFFQTANDTQADATATAASANAAADTYILPDVRLQIVVERRDMYTRCSDSMNTSTEGVSNVGAPFMCKNTITRGGVVVGIAMCKYVTDVASSMHRLSSVHLLYDTSAMSRLMAATGTTW